MRKEPDNEEIRTGGRHKTQVMKRKRGLLIKRIRSLNDGSDNQIWVWCSLL